MKKLIYAITAAAMIFTSCNDRENVVVEENDQNVNFVVNVTTGQGTRTIQTDWNIDDKIYFQPYFCYDKLYMLTKTETGWDVSAYSFDADGKAVSSTPSLGDFDVTGGSVHALFVQDCGQHYAQKGISGYAEVNIKSNHSGYALSACTGGYSVSGTTVTITLDMMRIGAEDTSMLSVCITNITSTGALLDVTDGGWNHMMMFKSFDFQTDVPHFESIKTYESKGGIYGYHNSAENSDTFVVYVTNGSPLKFFLTVGSKTYSKSFAGISEDKAVKVVGPTAGDLNGWTVE